MPQQSKETENNQPAARTCDVPKFEAADVLVREDIMQKAKHLAELICTTDEVKQYQHAEKLIQEHEQVQKTIALLKKKQKEIVAFESFNNKAMVQKIEAELDALQDELDHIPLVVQFQQSQTDVNYLLQLIMSVIRDSVSDKINVEAGRSDDPDSCSE